MVVNVSVTARLVERGQERVRSVCETNGWATPALRETLPRWLRMAACGLYDRRTIYVQASLCALPGYGGPAWSWPGYIVDRTPFGVYAHELGHYVDERYKVGRLWPSTVLRRESGEERLTSYCPNDAEWFAEMFRLFVTNPDLLKRIRPITYAGLTEGLGIVPVERRGYVAVLKDAPERTRVMAARRVFEARQ